MNNNERYNHEKEFWDKSISHVLENKSYKYKIENRYENLFTKIDYLKPIIDFWGDISDKKILDLGCGNGWISMSLGISGAIVYGIDISPRRIEIANKYLKENGLENNVKFETMICEEMTYEDNFFDFAFMHATLHHCDIEKTSEQIHRVLKPGGKAVFIEDFAYHPIMNLYRKLTPDKHTKYEKALDDKDLDVIVSHFSSHFYKYYGLLNLVETFNNPFLCRIKPMLRSIDNFIYNHIHISRKYSKLIGIFVVN
jgi:ubiquinone/menaquinone biosynthesis C-methylase UbiE